MKVIKKAFLLMIFGIAIILMIVGLFMLIHGSLEMFPTIEQQEKFRMAGVMALVLGAIFVFIGKVLWRRSL